MPAFGISYPSFTHPELSPLLQGYKKSSSASPWEDTQTQEQSLLPTAALDLPGLLLTFLGQQLLKSPAAFPGCLRSAWAAVFCKKYF